MKWVYIVLVALLCNFSKGSVLDKTTSHVSMVSGNPKYIVVTMVSRFYLPLLTNWIFYYERALNSESSQEYKLAILALDIESFIWCKNHNLEVHLLDKREAEDTGGLPKQIWLARVEFTKKAFTIYPNSLFVIQSDLDAIWFRNPVQELTRLNYSIISSRGKFPQNVSWSGPKNFTACMGFVVWKNNNYSKSILTELRDRMAILAKINPTLLVDDQRMFNTILRNELKILEWQHEPNLGESFKNEILILSNDLVDRECRTQSNISSAFIKHCHAPKNGLEKIKMLQQKGHWSRKSVSKHGRERRNYI